MRATDIVRWRWVGAPNIAWLPAEWFELRLEDLICDLKQCYRIEAEMANGQRVTFKVKKNISLSS